jgi:hypothetical protein
MTTAAQDGQRLRVTGVRPVSSPNGRLRVVGGSGRLRWWHFRLTLGLTLAGAMAGALAGVAVAFLDNGVAPRALLVAYGATAGVGASVGLLAGLVLGLVAGLLDRYVLPQSVQSRPLWVRYRRPRQPV